MLWPNSLLPHRSNCRVETPYQAPADADRTGHLVLRRSVVPKNLFKKCLARLLRRHRTAIDKIAGHRRQALGAQGFGFTEQRRDVLIRCEQFGSPLRRNPTKHHGHRKSSTISRIILLHLADRGTHTNSFCATAQTASGLPTSVRRLMNRLTGASLTPRRCRRAHGDAGPDRRGDARNAQMGIIGVHVDQRSRQIWKKRPRLMRRLRPKGVSYCYR
jgi:hypothetical protein